MNDNNFSPNLQLIDMNRQKKADSLFDTIAEAYYTFTPALPKEYIQLLVDTFKITSQDSIIDLGCGSGDLALALAQFSPFIQGIDSSKKMITMATNKDLNKKVRWIHKSVNDFNFGEKRYNLIISFESFHLFLNPVELIKKCARALKPGGILCIGWAMYAFDPPLKSTIEETFAKAGIPWDDWGAWTCPSFSKMITQANVGFSLPKQKSIYVSARIPSKNIIDYFFNISKTASLKESIKQKISQELWKKISTIYPSGESVGNDQYAIMYCKK